MATKKKAKVRLTNTSKGGSGIQLINMIPKSLSGDSGQDSEPMLSVNSSNPLHMVASAFTNNPMGGNLAPIYVSTNGGNSWTLNAIVPADQPRTNDITVAFSGTGKKLFAGILGRSRIGNQTRMLVLRTDEFDSPTPMDTLEDRQQPDQPFTQATTVSEGPDRGLERLYVGNNDLARSNKKKTATIDVSLDSGAATPKFKKVRLEKRVTPGQDGPQVRPSIHPDGTVYAAYYGWRAITGNFRRNSARIKSDVVVVRDDNWGSGDRPFEDLLDPDDDLSGIRVAKNVSFAFNLHGIPANGQQRLGGNLSIAVDPRPKESSTVYLTWNDEPTPGVFTTHVRRSTDRGLTWSPSDLLTIPKGTNAAIAINSEGEIGLLTQELAGTSTSPVWTTRFRRSLDGKVWSDLILTSAPADVPRKQFDPYIGDYSHLLAVGSVFYGIFGANNTPNPANFPNDVTYQRNHDFTSQKLLAVDGVREVNPSIDPFFFRTTG